MMQTVAPKAVATPQAGQPVGSPSAIYRGLRDQREVLGNQLSNAQNQREELVSQLGHDGQSAATKASLEKRILNMDARITDLDQQIAKSEQAVAQAASVPGATYRPPDVPRDRPDPDMIVGFTALIAIIIVLPMSIAFARRVWRRSANATVTLPPEVAQRMESLERGVDAIALEVERIGEGQRFMTQALTERSDARGLGAGAAEPVPVPVRQRERQEERQ